MKWLQSAPDREPLGVRPADLRADPGVELERRDVASARAAAVAGRGDPAAGPGAVHQARGSRSRPRPSCRHRPRRRRRSRRRRPRSIDRGRRAVLGRSSERARARPRRAARRRCSWRRRPRPSTTFAPYGQRRLRGEDEDRVLLGPADGAGDRLAADRDREGARGAAPVHRLREADRDRRRRGRRSCCRRPAGSGRRPAPWSCPDRERDVSSGRPSVSRTPETIER